MKIKDAEILTGLPAKTIRYYESQGLISIKRNSNTYRDYTENNITELRRIKILRKLDVPISKIKEFTQGEISLHYILQNEIKNLDGKEINLVRKKSTIEVLLKDLKKNPNLDLVQYYEDFEYIEGEEFNEMLYEIKELSEFSLSSVLLYTLILSGPLLWLFTNISRENYEFIGINSFVAIICTILLTLTWSKFLKQPNKKFKGTVSLLLGLITIVVLSIVIFIGITKLQENIFVPNDYLMFMFKSPYSYLFLFFEIELIVLFTAALYKRVKNVEWKWANELFNFIRKHIVATVIFNLFLLYVCITSITVVTKNQIVDYSFYNLKGTSYSYNDISKVETGFQGKFLKVLRGHAGDFYYIVNFKDGKKINFYQANSPFEDTYLELEIFDDLIMDTGKSQKISSTDNCELCSLDQRYIDRFLKIIENK